MLAQGIAVPLSQVTLALPEALVHAPTCCLGVAGVHLSEWKDGSWRAAPDSPGLKIAAQFHSPMGMLDLFCSLI